MRSPCPRRSSRSHWEVAQKSATTGMAKTARGTTYGHGSATSVVRAPLSPVLLTLRSRDAGARVDHPHAAQLILRPERDRPAATDCCPAGALAPTSSIARAVGAPGASSPSSFAPPLPGPSSSTSAFPPGPSPSLRPFPRVGTQTTADSLPEDTVGRSRLLRRMDGAHGRSSRCCVHQLDSSQLQACLGEHALQALAGRSIVRLGQRP